MFTICSFIFGSDIQRSQNFSYKRTNPQQSGGIQSAVLTLMNAVYGTTKLGVHPYVAKVYKSIRLNHNMQSNAVSIFFFLERHVNYFLSIFLNVPIQDINIMLKKKLITVNGAFVSERYLIRNFDFITFNCTKPAVSDSLNIFNQLYNNSAF